MSAPAPAPAVSGSGMSQITTSAIKNVFATDAAFSSAHRTTCVETQVVETQGQNTRHTDLLYTRSK